MMRITYILDTFGRGGKERRCLQLIQGLNREGYNDIQVIIIDNRIQYKELYDTTAKIHVIGRKESKLGFIETVKIVKGLLKDFRPDIVQVWGWVSAALGLVIYPFMDFKLIGSYVANCDKPKSGSFSFFVNAFCKQFCDKIVGNSKEGLKVYGIPLKKAELIYNGFNEDRLLRKIDKARKKEDLEITTPFVVAMIAVFRKDKDWACYLDTAKSIIDNQSDITFLAIGSGPRWEEYNQSITEQYRPLLKMLGQRGDIDEILQICDLTVLASNHGEGVSNSILESMAFGVPVIATNTGGTPEIITPDVNGVLMPGNDINLLKKEILRIVNDSDTRDALGRAAQDTVKEQFLLNQMTKKYICLYSSLLKRN